MLFDFFNTHFGFYIARFRCFKVQSPWEDYKLTTIVRGLWPTKKKRRKRVKNKQAFTKLQVNLYTFSIKNTQQLKNNKLDTVPPPAPYTDLFRLKPFYFLSESASLSADVF